MKSVFNQRALCRVTFCGTLAAGLVGPRAMPAEPKPVPKVRTHIQDSMRPVTAVPFKPYVPAKIVASSVETSANFTVILPKVVLTPYVPPLVRPIETAAISVHSFDTTDTYVINLSSGLEQFSGFPVFSPSEANNSLYERELLVPKTDYLLTLFKNLNFRWNLGNIAAAGSSFYILASTAIATPSVPYDSAFAFTPTTALSSSFTTALAIHADWNHFSASIGVWNDTGLNATFADASLGYSTTITGFTLAAKLLLSRDLTTGANSTTGAFDICHSLMDSETVQWHAGVNVNTQKTGANFVNFDLGITAYVGPRSPFSMSAEIAEAMPFESSSAPHLSAIAQISYKF